LGDPFAGFFGESGEDFLKFPAGEHGAGGAKHIFGFGDCGDTLEPVVFDPEVGWEIGDIDAPVVVEAVVGRTTGDRLCEIDFFFHGFNAFRGFFGFKMGVGDFQNVVDDLAVLIAPIHAEMPLADHAGGVAVLLQEFGDGEAIFFDKRRAP